MPVRYVIERHRRLLRIFASGHFAAAEVIEVAHAIGADPDYDPSFDQLVDLSEVQSVGASAIEVRRLAEDERLRAGARRVLVAGNNLVYGLCRMYIAYADGQCAELRVFRGLAAAESFLGLSPPPSPEHPRIG